MLTSFKEDRATFPKSVSDYELKQQELTTERARLSVEQAARDMRIANLSKELRASELEAATIRLTRRQVTAPIDGIVVELLAQPGEWLKPGDPVVRIIRIDRLRIVGLIDGTKYGNELVNRVAEFAVTVPGRSKPSIFPGKVTFVSPEVSPGRGQSKIWAEIENRDRLLKAGISGVLTILPEKEKSDTGSKAASRE